MYLAVLGNEYMLACWTEVRVSLHGVAKVAVKIYFVS